MVRTAFTRFWRGVREPWDLLGRMRLADRPLWARYWRTVAVQAALTLVAGLAVFWVGKQGADVWRDAFGPEELPESSAPATAGESRTPGTTAPAAVPGRQPSTPGTVAGQPPPPTAVPAPPGRVPARKSVPHAPPPPPAPIPAPRSRAPAAAPSPSAPSTVAEAQAEEEEAEEDDSGGSETESSLEEKVKALQEAPPEERGKRTAELVAAAVEKAKTEASRAQRRAERRKDKGNDAAEELTEEREGVSEKLEELTIAAEALASEAPQRAGEARRARRQLEKELDEVQKEARALERRGAPPLTEKDRARVERVQTALRLIRLHERGLAGRLGAVLALLAAIYASLGIAQTGILAFSRDFHDALSRDLSLLIHVAPEDPPMRPKVRLDLPWVRRKAKRRARFFLGFLPGTVLISIVGWLVPPHRTLTTVLTALWAAYWWMVMTAAQSARAWTPPETTQRPWYMRAWFGLIDRVFLFRWGLPRWWGRAWERLARNFYGPSERIEEQPFEFAGLGLSRAVLLIPVVKLLFRPLFPVCAAHLLVEHAEMALLPVPVTAAEVADAASHAPDPEARAHSGVASPARSG